MHTRNFNGQKLTKISCMQDKELIKLGKRIEELREKAGLSMSALSFRNGIELSTLSKIEKAQVEAKYKTLLKIAAALNMTLSELVDFE